MRFRKLRIAWSVGCAIACVLPIVLWVRGYWKFDLGLVRLNTSSDLRIVSCRGRVAFCISQPSSGLVAGEFRISPNAWMYSGAPRWMSGALHGGLGKELQRNFEPNPYQVFLSGPDGRIFTIPIWVSFGLSGTVATVPWLGWSTRFSLRTMLIATTLVAVVLGAVVYAAGY